MTAIANIGSNFVVALPPSEIWLNDLQAAEYLGYKDVHFKAAVCCQPNFRNHALLLIVVKGDVGIWQKFQTG